MLPPWTDDARARADDKSSSAAARNASAAATAAPRQQQQQAATYVSADTNDNVDGSSSSRRQGDATAASAATVTTSHDTNNNNDDDADNALTSLFAHGQPKDVLAGVRDGVRNAVLGVGSGLLSLVAAPVVGAREDGVVGALRGVAVGAVGAAAMTTYGVVTGVRQLCIGAANTPQALQAVAHGEQLWDSTLQQWHTVQLQRELDELPVTDEDVDVVAREAFVAAQRARAQAEAEAEADAAAQDDDNTTSNNNSNNNNNNSSDGSEQTTRTTPRDDGDYYAILGVSRGATATELRRAYMQQALLLHPDRNAGNAQATPQFQQLQQAYKTLSNPSARVVYDQLGSSNRGGASAATGTATATAAAAAAMAAMSAGDTDNPIEEVLAVSFLEPLVGRLAFLDYFRGNVLYNTAQRRELYRRRRLRMARTLCSFLDREGGGHYNSSSSGSSSSSSSSADESNDVGFAAAREVLHDAVGTRLGPQLVGFVAQQYAAVARQHLHNSTLLRELDSWFTSKTITAAFLGNLATTTAGSTLAMARQRRLSEAEVNQLLVLAVEVDVKRTVARACRLVLYDRSVSDAQRQRRATRLAALAQLAQHEVDVALASQSSLSSATA